jgi:hypothetical protein
LSLFIRVIAVVLLATSAPLARAAEPPKDIADLFPPGALAYAELHNPAELAPQLAAVFKGTALEDSIPFIHARKDTAKTLVELTGKRQLAFLGLLTSPEMLGEFKKLRVAAALTGFTDNGEPEGVLVILTHDSPAAGLAARAYITMTPQLRKVGEVAKVPVFQFRTPRINYDPNGNPTVENDKPLSDGPHEMTIAYTPGLIAVGTSKTAVGHAIKRFLGEEKGGLSGNAAFKEAAATHRQTGLFFYVNFPDFAAKFGGANRLRGGGQGGMEKALLTAIQGGDYDLLEWFKMTANPKAVKSVAGCVRFRDGGISATMAATFDPAHKSPLLEFLSGPGVKLDLLHHARHPATFALGVSFPEKNRAAAVIGFLDSIAKANGELGRLPSDVVKELEEKYKLPVRDALIGKIRAVTVVMPTKQELPKGGKPGPMLILHTDDAATAAAWEDFLPKLIGDLAGAASAPMPSTETINGVKVFSLSGSGLRWNAPVHYARNGTAVAIGLDRKLVAGAVTADAVTSVIGGDKAVSPPGGDPAAVFGILSLGDVITALIEKPRSDGPVVPIDGDTVPILPNGLPVPESLLEDIKKSRKELFAALGALSPATVTVRRVGNELRVELFQPKVQNGALKTVIDAAASWLDKSASLMGNARERFEYELRGRW